MNGDEVRADDPLRGVNVDVVVARWLQWCLEGHMTVEHLSQGLQSLAADLESAPGELSRRLTTLQAEVQAVLTSGSIDLARIESSGVTFLGSHPSIVLDAAAPPDWYMTR